MLLRGLIRRLLHALKRGIGVSLTPGRADVVVTSNPSWTDRTTTDSTVFVTAGIEAQAGDWLIIGIVNTGLTVQDPSSVVATNGSLPLTKQGSSFTVGTVNNCRCSVYARRITEDYVGTVTITFGATATACCWSPVVVSGGSLQAIRQISAGATGTGTDVDAAALSSFEHKNNLCLSFNVARAGSFTPGSGFTEHGESTITVSPAVKIQSQYATNDPSADATLDVSAEWGAIALEFEAGLQ